MYYDEVKIYVKGGRGGNGAVAFRREKYIPYGGPSGGDGGRGGDVVLVVTRHRNTLFHLRHRNKFVADGGEHGRSKQQYGAGAEDLLIEVPEGTLVTEEKSGALLADLTEHGRRFVVARGGKGGRGNIHFATSTRQTPRISEKGDPGEERYVKLELKLLADIGLVGKPNAGKSTLLSVTTSAEPKIAAYPFTTLQPNLGVVALDAQTTFVMADVPGLIEGASQGKGLGHEFLRHIERTGILIHLIDGTAPDPVADFKAINVELASFGHKLMEKEQLVAINKLDMPQAAERFLAIKAAIEELGYPVMGISAITHQGVRKLLGRALQMLEELPAPEPQMPTPVVIRPNTFDDGFAIEPHSDGLWVVSGGKIERAVQRTNLNQPESVMRLHRYLKSKGVLDELRKRGVQENDLVRIGEYELEWRSSDE